LSSSGAATILFGEFSQVTDALTAVAAPVAIVAPGLSYAAAAVLIGLGIAAIPRIRSLLNNS